MSKRDVIHRGLIALAAVLLVAGSTQFPLEWSRPLVAEGQGIPVSGSFTGYIEPFGVAFTDVVRVCAVGSGRVAAGSVLTLVEK